MAVKNAYKFTAELKAKFLDILRANGGIIGTACDELKVSRMQMYNHRRDDPQFAKDWAQAVDDGVDVLEDECKERALNGTDKPVIWQGRVTRKVKEKSDYCLGLVLRAHRAKYRLNTTELSGPGGEPIQTTVFYIPDAAPPEKPK